MSTNQVAKSLNNFIGGKWTLLGLMLFAAGLLWLLGSIFADVFRAVLPGVPVPSDPFDFAVIFSLLFLGYFFTAWGSAMLRRREWGAVAGGMVRIVLTIYLLLGAFVFYQNSIHWLQGDALNFYNRYAWLLWSIFGLGILWLLATTGFLLVSRSRRDYYAETYRTSPPPSPPTCPNCGLIFENQLCPECDMPKRDGWLVIGGRRELLPFTAAERAFIIGRQKDNNEAYITISEGDTEHPERISGRHIMIQYHFDYKQFTIEDLASTNKTYLRDDPEPLLPNTPYRLDNGDKINLAKDVNLVFECDESSS